MVREFPNDQPCNAECHAARAALASERARAERAEAAIASIEVIISESRQSAGVMEYELGRAEARLSAALAAFRASKGGE